jgi:uncharacterized membrane protein
MLWLLLALLSAVSQSTSDLFSKKGLQSVNNYTVAFARSFFAVLCLLPFLLVIGIPELESAFWLVLLINGSLSTVASLLYMKAIQLSPLSLTIPMLAFTPLFLLLTSPLMLGEYPSPFGFVGMILIVLGTYFLRIRDVQEGCLAPFKALVNEKGALLMLLIAFIYSICANLMKLGVQSSNPFIYPIAHNAFTSIVLFPVSLINPKESVKTIVANIKILFPTGLFHALLEIFALTALEISIVPYVISVRRTTILFSTLFGRLVFKEKRIKERLLGASIMVAGVVLISLC